MTEGKMYEAYANFHISTSLSRLREQENEYQQFVMDSHVLRDHITSLKYGLRFLECFLRFSKNRCLKLRILRVAYEVSLKLGSISDHSVSQVELESAYASLLEKFSTITVNRETVSDHVSVLLPRITGKGLYFNIINDVLVQSLGDLRTLKADLIKEVEELKEKLELFKPLCTFLAEVYIEFDLDLVCLFREVACVVYSCLVDKKVDVDSIKTQLKIVLRKIDIKEIYMRVLRASLLRVSITRYDCKLLINVIYLLHCNRRHLNLQSEELHKELMLLQSQINALNPDLRREKRKRILVETCVENFTCHAIPILYSCNVLKMEREKSEKLDQTLSQIREHIKHFLSQLGELELDCYPKTDALGFLEVFCSNLKELRVSRPQLIETLSIEIEVLYLNFDQLRSFFSIPGCVEEHNDIWLLFISLAYDAEYVIDLFLVNGFDPRIKPSVSRIMEKVQLVKMKLIRTDGEDFQSVKGVNVINTGDNHGETLSSESSKGTLPTTSDFVGFQDELRNTMESVFHGPMKLDVVSIVGMPGLGKTTLAMKVYDDPLVARHFDIKVWCMVSQTYRRRELWLSILRGLGFNINEFCHNDDDDDDDTGGDDDICEDHIFKTKYKDNVDVDVDVDVGENSKNDDDKDKGSSGTVCSDADGGAIDDDDILVEKIAQSLKRRRYLIVFDDMWDVNAWKELRRYLPDDHCGSRVLITTRLESLAAETTLIHSNVRKLRPFFENESLELFMSKLGTRESYSKDLLQVGHQIALSCNGLPLAIVVIAGLLSKEKKSVEKWKEIAKSINSHILSDPERPYKGMLELSYNHLPDYLKPCFQYIGAFKGNIPMKKLKLLWIAEGFVRSSKYATLEKLAEEYLMDLISRSLLTPTQRRTCGGVKSCRAHDLIYDFCIEKSEEEHFMHKIYVNSWSELLKPYDQHRLCISSQGRQFHEPLCSGHRVRSLLYFSSETRNNSEYYASFLAREFKILRVLDLAFINIGRSFDTIKSLIHLRYLAVCALFTSIPSSISNLGNLQTLLVEATTDSTHEAVYVPDSLCDMVNLTNVHIDHLASFHVEQNRLENSSFLESIETLSTPCLSTSDDAEKLLKRMRKLQKLRCAFKNDSMDNIEFPVLDYLTQLESLRIAWVGSSPTTGRSHEFKFPSQLRKLSLEGFMFTWDEMSKVGRNLPNLEALKIISSGYDDTWNVSDEDFVNLKYLKLSDSKDIADWVASEESFPKLEHVLIEDCKSLMEFPPRFEDAPSLRMITVIRCNHSLNDSAGRIGQKQKEEAQVEGFIVNITYSDILEGAENSNNEEVQATSELYWKKLDVTF